MMNLRLPRSFRRSFFLAFPIQIIRTFSRFASSSKHGRLRELMIPLQSKSYLTTDEYLNLLHLCAEVGSPPQPEIIHSCIIQAGLGHNSFLGTKILNMYTKCGSIESAHQLFDKMSEENPTVWNFMIAAYAKQGRHNDAMIMFRRMLREGNFKPNHFTFAGVLSACAHKGGLGHGRMIHRHIVESGYGLDECSGTALVDMYGKCGALRDARQVVDRMPTRSTVTCNVMISALMNHGLVDDAWDVFRSMPERTVVTWTSMVKGLAENGYLDDAVQLFDKMPERNQVSWNAMITGYAQHGRIDCALQMFHSMPWRNHVSWSVIINVFAQSGQCEKALEAFWQMIKCGLRANSQGFAGVLLACSELKDVHQGRKIHHEAVRAGLEKDVFVGCGLVNMYSKCGFVDEARIIFDKIEYKDTPLWNAMISGYSLNNHIDQAVALFEKMPVRDLISCNIMIEALGHNGYLEEAEKLFSEMTSKDLVTWNTMMSVYAHNGDREQTMEFFRRMQLSGIKPDAQTFLALLQTCSNLGSLVAVNEIHREIIKFGIASHLIISNSLVDIYAKCGSTEAAREIFDTMESRDVISWNAIITCYANSGGATEAIALFHQMQQSGIKPNAITFVAVLSACRHVGKLDEALSYFESMKRDYDISPTLNHYTCVVHLLVRAGKLNEAKELIKSMPMKLDEPALLSMLGSGRDPGGNLTNGQDIATSPVELDERFRQIRTGLKTPCCEWISDISSNANYVSNASFRVIFFVLKRKNALYL